MSLPGKKIAWKISNALSKLIAQSPPRVAKNTSVPVPQVNRKLKPKGLHRVNFFSLFSIISTVLIAKDTIKSTRFKVKSPLQSLKCPSPSLDEAKTPVPYSLPGRVKKSRISS